MIQGRNYKTKMILVYLKKIISFFTSKIVVIPAVLIAIFILINGSENLQSLYLKLTNSTKYSLINLEPSSDSLTSDPRKIIAEALTPFIKKNEFPEKINIYDQSLDVTYSVNPDLQNEADKLLQKYKPDYGAIVVMNALTGEILALSSFVKNHEDYPNLNLKASFPAASIFKIITASTAIDRNGINPDHEIAFNGGNYTLYKKNVLSDKTNRWTRIITLKDAFARSINTAFARLTLEKLKPHDLIEYAKRFMFNKYIPSDFTIEQSQATIPEEKSFALAEVTSGFNRFNTLSPVHAAMIGAAIINDGYFVAPYLVKELKNQNETYYTAKPFVIGQAVSKLSAEKIRSLMEQTILSGTSRKTFRKIVKDKNYKEVEMGGKTGHFSGLDPKGRNDWFVGYASDGMSKISVAAITVNVEKWTVKSSALAEMMLRKHFKSVAVNSNHLTQKERPKTSNQRRPGNDRNLLVDAESDKKSNF